MPAVGLEALQTSPLSGHRNAWCSEKPRELGKVWDTNSRANTASVLTGKDHLDEF